VATLVQGRVQSNPVLRIVRRFDYLQGMPRPLVGQDRFFGLAGHPNYDWPNPHAYRRRQLRSAVTNLTWLCAFPHMLRGQDVQFAGPGQWKAYDWPNPKGRPYPSDLRTFIHTQQAATAAVVLPFGIAEWKNPPRRDYPMTLRTFLDPTRTWLIGTESILVWLLRRRRR
jgi:hypothetical protein